MSISQPNPVTKTTSQDGAISITTFLFGAWLLLPILAIYFLWWVRIQNGDLLSSAVIATILMIPILIVTFIRRLWIMQQLERVPERWRILVLIVLAVGTLALWLLLNSTATFYVAANSLIIGLIITSSLEDRPLRFTGWLLLMAAVIIVVLFLPLMLTTFVTKAENPGDEAYWADVASSFFLFSKLSPLRMLREFTIEPGNGWSLAAYGWLLTNVSFDVWVGRAWIFALNIIAIVGVGAITTRLYGRQAGIISLIFAYLSENMTHAVMFRPDHQIPGGAMMLTLLFVVAWQQTNPRWRMILYGLSGFAATLMLQLHAMGILISLALSSLVLIEYAATSWQKRRLTDPRCLIAFAAGGLIGVGLHYALNVAPAGGYITYLNFLTMKEWTTRDVLNRGFAFLKIENAYDSWFVRVISWIAILYVLLRRNQSDRLYLAILGILLFWSAISDPNGYHTTLVGFTAVPIGAWIVGIYSCARLNRRVVIGTALLFLLMLGQTKQFISYSGAWQWLQTGTFTDVEAHHKVIAQWLMNSDYVRPDDTIVTTSEMIWGMPTVQFISLTTEYEVVLGESILYDEPLENPVEHWRQLKPDLIVISDDFTGKLWYFGPPYVLPRPSGLQQYMDEYNFMLCASHSSGELDAYVFRADCDGPTQWDVMAARQ